MKKSSYHNTLQAWIKGGLLINYEIQEKRIATKYDSVKKVYVGPKTLQEVLILNFKHKSYFVRKPYIEEYLEFIKGIQIK